MQLKNFSRRNFRNFFIGVCITIATVIVLTLITNLLIGDTNQSQTESDQSDQKFDTEIKNVEINKHTYILIMYRVGDNYQFDAEHSPECEYCQQQGLNISYKLQSNKGQTVNY